MPSESNSRIGIVGRISFIAMIWMIATALLIPPTAWSQGVHSGPQFAYVAGNDFVSGYVIDNTTGALTEIAGSPFPTGVWARGVAADPQGRFLYIPNWNSANVSAYVIDRDTGALSAVPGSPFAAGDHPAAVAVDPRGRFVYIANQYSNSISVYSIDPITGALTAVTGSPFGTYTGPVGLAAGPSGEFLYVANFGGEVSVYAIASAGSLTEIPGSPFYAGSGTFQVAITPSGKFAYAAAQYSDGVFAYSIESSTGALTEISGSPFPAGSDPYFIATDPSGRFVYTANFYFALKSGNVSGYRIDAKTGALSEIFGSPFPAGNNPGGIATDLSGRFVYTTNDGSSTSSGYVIDQSTGALTPIPGSPFPTAINPISVTTVGNPERCTTPPVVKVFNSPTFLWPPNGRLARVAVFGTITDPDAACRITTAAYSVKDEYGKVQPTGPVVLNSGGAYRFTIGLQASRSGTDSNGRLYTITVTAMNNAGKKGRQAGKVIVPHDKRH